MIASRIKNDNKGIATAIIAIIVIAVIAAAAVGAYILMDDKDATVVYTVKITPSEDVDLCVYIDGEEIYKERLEADWYHERTRTYYYPMQDDIEKTVTIKAVVYDVNGRELQSVSKSIELVLDEMTKVTLAFLDGASDLGYEINFETEQIVDVFVYRNGMLIATYEDETGPVIKSAISTYYITGDSDTVPFKIEVIGETGSVIKESSVTIRPGEQQIVDFIFGDFDNPDV